MIAKAHERKLYTRLIAGDLTEILAQHPDAFDLIIAVDVFIHIGDLAPTFAAAAQSLRNNGLFALCTEALDPAQTVPYTLNPATRRYAHNLTYLQQLAKKSGLTQRAYAHSPLRTESNTPVQGHYLLLQRAGPTGAV